MKEQDGKAVVTDSPTQFDRDLILASQKKEDQDDNQAPENKDVDVFRTGEEKKKEEYPLIMKFLNNMIFNILINVFTIYALFGDDIRVMAFRKDADFTFDVLTIIALILFSVEIVLAFITRPVYRWSFFFWLDLVSTISLILDINLVAESLFFGGSTAKTAQLARAGRASRVGTKAGRVVRLVRLIRIVKLYQNASKQNNPTMTMAAKKKSLFQDKLNEKKMRLKKRRLSQLMSQVPQINSDTAQDNTNNQGLAESIGPLPEQDPINSSAKIPENQQEEIQQEDQEFKESRVSQRLSDLTTKRVIMIVLLLLFIMPLFTADYYFDPPKSLDISMVLIQNISQNKNVQKSDITAIFNQIIEQHSIDYGPVAQFNTPFSQFSNLPQNFATSDFDLLRNDELDLSSETLDLKIFKESVKDKPQFSDVLAYFVDNAISDDDDTGKLDFLSYMNTRELQIQTAGLGLGRTIFVCIILTVGALMFSKDSNDIALRPIERMIDKVNKIAKNPISAQDNKLIINEQGIDQFETTVIENAIIKIGTLLALGFGDAGSEIIATNMAQSGDVDPMIPGQQQNAIYGFCDIRNFTDATQVLQEEVMMFVNNIGEIVHSMVDRFLGAANKNIGDAFLLVWKIPQEYYLIRADNTIEYLDEMGISIYADLSLLSFMKIQAKVNRQHQILAYRKDPRLQDRMKNYKVKMGFGLHIGWGIEGAIGSEFKIDASYLSPNVNMASQLEGATKSYGVPLLISGDLYDRFTPELQRYVRQIDHVSIKTSSGNSSTGIYTIDMSVDDLPPSKLPDLTTFTRQEQSQIDKQKKNLILNLISEKTLSTEIFIKENQDLKLIMSKWNEDWQNQFKTGFQCYKEGKWKQAREIFQNCLVESPNDGPSRALINFMENDQKMVVPANWSDGRPMPD